MDAERLSHAYIIAAEPEDGYAQARRLAQTMLCSAPDAARPCGVCRNCVKAAKDVHPDILTISRQTDEKGKPKREIYVEQVREVVASSAVLPNEAERKVYIFRDAGTMNPAVQNALLKLLEEPPKFVSLILVADRADQLLETVRSRCVLLRGGTETALPAAVMAEAEAYLQLAAGGSRAALLHFALSHETLSNAEMLEFAAAARALLGDMLCARHPSGGLSHAELLRLSALLRQTEDYLRSNVSAKHIWGMLTVGTLPPEPAGSR